MYFNDEGVSGVLGLAFGLSTADLGRRPSFHPGWLHGLGRFISSSLYRSRPPPSQPSTLLMEELAEVTTSDLVVMVVPSGGSVIADKDGDDGRCGGGITDRYCFLSDTQHNV